MTHILIDEYFSSHNQDQKTRAVTRLLRMPQFALSGPPTGIEARLRAIAADTSVREPPEDTEESPHPPSQAQKHTDVKIVARVQTLAKAGSVERAAAALEPQTVNMTGAFHTLILAGAHIRLQPSLHKCHVYGTPGTAAFNAPGTD